MRARAEPRGAAALGDFTATWRVVPMALAGVGIGVLAAYVALALLRLIGLFTHLFFFQRWDSALVSPAGSTLGPLVVLVPVGGALVIGVMARYGSERIRGHGIPEAIESILIGGSRVEPRLAVLKPLSAAISIGSGGPFGAEGPIIMTGGAFGSLVAQFFELTAAERKTLLVAGAAAGMSATFASPVAAVLLAVELLLFEWKPRSMVPVGLASATASAARRYIIGLGPLFPTPPHPLFIGPAGLVGCVVTGLAAGALSALLTLAVYGAEDAFRLLPVGGALGGLEAAFLPSEGAGFWPLVSMGAMLGGTMRSPFTGVVFAVELTHDVSVLLPLLLAVTIAHATTVLALRRSILTEKVARRGYHLTREYAVDPLEILSVREVMRPGVAVLPAELPLAGLERWP